VLAGVGNLYRCEVLFRHRVDPFRRGKEIRPTTWLAIWDVLVRLMLGQVLTMDDQVTDAMAEGRGWFSGRADGSLDRGATR